MILVSLFWYINKYVYIYIYINIYVYMLHVCMYRVVSTVGRCIGLITWDRGFDSHYPLLVPSAIERDILIAPVNDVVAWDDPDAMGIDEWMKAIHSKITAERLAGCENIATAQEKQKKMYDVKHLGPFYKVGVKVLLKNCWKDTRQGDKWHCKNKS